MRKAAYTQMARFYRANYSHLLPADRATPIAELGCGAGHFLYFLRQEGYTNVSAVDLSPEMVATCHKLGFDQVELGDVISFLERHPTGFGAIICNDLIEHIPRSQMIRFVESARAALTAGVFVVKTINASSLFGAREVFIDFTHEVGFTPESLAQVLRLGGFVDVAVRPLHTAPTTWRGHALRFVQKAVIETLLKALIFVLEGQGSRQPVVLTSTMLAAASSERT